MSPFAVSNIQIHTRSYILNSLIHTCTRVYIHVHVQHLNLQYSRLLKMGQLAHYYILRREKAEETSREINITFTASSKLSLLVDVCKFHFK